MLVKKYQKGSLELKFIKKLIHENENRFVPSLSKEIDIPKYAKKLCENANCLLLEDNSHNIIGFVFYYHITEKPKPALYISLICSVKKGFGQKLYRELLKHESPLINNITLEVDKNNKQALSFYEKMGFLPIKAKSNGNKLILNHKLTWKFL